MNISMLLWLDLETTGLDPQHCRIIEAAWFLTPLIQTLGPVRKEPKSLTLVAPQAPHSCWEEGALKMHQASGLYELCTHLQPDLQSVYEVEQAILKDIQNLDGPIILAGSSPHFDRGFIQKWWPSLNRKLYYRHFDVSSTRMFLESQGYVLPELKHKPHRAAEDITNSYALYWKCARHTSKGVL